jgi:cation diffusion facilitator family transporter
MLSSPRLTRFAWLSIGAALLTMAIKAVAYWLTGSVGLLSDALESTVNLAAALMTLAALYVTVRPPDEEHAYGHTKVEYFSSGVEGTLIMIAALTIAVAAVGRLFHPRSLDHLGLGLAVATAASLINLGVAFTLRHAGTRYRSIALEADSQHLMTDVWSSAGVLIGVGAVAVTGWTPLDPMVGLIVAANIARQGILIVRRSALGLMDTALPPAEMQLVRGALELHSSQGVKYHALRSRQAGARRFVSMHIQVPGNWTVQRGHDLLEAIEADIRHVLPGVTVFTHIEPLEDPASWADERLDRVETSET